MRVFCAADTLFSGVSALAQNSITNLLGTVNIQAGPQ